MYKQIPVHFLMVILACQAHAAELLPLDEVTMEMATTGSSEGLSGSFVETEVDESFIETDLDGTPVHIIEWKILDDMTVLEGVEFREIDVFSVGEVGQDGDISSDGIETQFEYEIIISPELGTWPE